MAKRYQPTHSLILLFLSYLVVVVLVASGHYNHISCIYLCFTFRLIDLVCVFVDLRSLFTFLFFCLDNRVPIAICKFV